MRLARRLCAEPDLASGYPRSLPYGARMDTGPTTQRYVSVPAAATRLGLPVSWLKAELEAGRLPGLQLKRRRLVNVDDLAKVLRERSRAEASS